MGLDSVERRIVEAMESLSARTRFQGGMARRNAIEVLYRRQTTSSDLESSGTRIWQLRGTARKKKEKLCRNHNRFVTLSARVLLRL